VPVLEIGSVEAVIEWVNSRSRPLGLYVSAEDIDVAEHILDAIESGDAAINDCAIHPLVPELPFEVWIIRGWANTMVDGVSRRSLVRAASLITASVSTPACATHRTRSIL
jgi:acyl-CoA reductase-like NAD-dependent aldehyde dehydrogenase